MCHNSHMNSSRSNLILFPKLWNPISQPLYFWVPTFERILNSISIPPLNGPVIYVSSDYGGQQKDSLYETISLVYLDIKASSIWETDRRNLRERFLENGRRMSFKSLNDYQRQEALVPFLHAANKISGIAITVAIRKTVRNICSDEEFFRYSQKALKLDPKMKFRISNKCFV